MSHFITLPEDTPSFLALAPAADAAGRTSSFFSLKNAHRAYAVVTLTQGNAATVALTITQATTVAGAGAKAIAGTHRIWAAQDVATLPVVAAVADAASFTTSAALANKMVVIEIDPQVNLDVAGGFDCIAITTGASNAANITSASLVIVPRDKRASAINPRVN